MNRILLKRGLRKNEGEIVVSFRFQLLMILITTVLFFFGITKFHKSFFSLDYSPKKNSMQIEKNILYGVHLHLKDVVEADWARNKFTFGIDVTVKMPEECSVLDEEAMSKKMIFSKGRIISTILTKKGQIENGFEYRWYLIIETYCKFNYTLFPFDDHVLQLHFRGSKNIFSNGAPELSATTKAGIDLGGWKAVNNTVESNDDGDWYDLRFFFCLSKSGYRTALAIFFPLLILFFMSILTMSMIPSEASKSILSILLGINSYRMVVENASPKTASVLAIDYFYLFFLLASFLFFAIHLAEVRIKKWLGYIIVVGSHFLLLSLFFFLVKHWL